MGFRQARINAGLSVRTVMAEMGVTDAAVYMWETGATKPRTSTLVKLAGLYRCSVDELLNDDIDQSHTKNQRRSDHATKDKAAGGGAGRRGDPGL